MTAVSAAQNWVEAGLCVLEKREFWNLKVVDVYGQLAFTWMLQIGEGSLQFTGRFWV